MILVRNGAEAIGEDRPGAVTVRTCTRQVAEDDSTTKTWGRGLGRAAALGIAQGYHGAITVRSEPGQGSTFDVFLPPAKPCG